MHILSALLQSEEHLAHVPLVVSKLTCSIFEREGVLILMKVALINPPHRGELNFTKPTYPLGLGYLKAMCKNLDIFCDLFDFSSSILSDIELCTKYKLSDYDYIGISTYTINFMDTLELIKLIKTDKNIIILGGHHASLLGKKILEDFNFIDYAMMGYAEYTFTDFLKLQGKDEDALHQIPGLCYRKNGIAYSNEAVYDTLNLGELPYPNREDIIFNFPAGLTDSGELPIISSRGCTFRCAYCVNCRRTFWLTREINDVIDEISLQFEKSNYRIINFIDCNFFINPKRAAEIINAINNLQADAKITFQTRSDQIVKNESIVRQLLNTRKVKIYIGVESNSHEVLTRLKKDTTPQDNQKAVDIIKDYYNDVIIYTIMFEPVSTLNEIRVTFDFFKNNKLYSYLNSKGLPQPMIPLYGTDYYDEFKDHYDIDIHSISKPIYVEQGVKNLKDCFDAFISEYDDQIKEKLHYIKDNGQEIDIGDFKFFSIIYFYVFEFFLIHAEKQVEIEYNDFKHTSIAEQLEKYLLKYHTQMAI